MQKNENNQNIIFLINKGWTKMMQKYLDKSLENAEKVIKFQENNTLLFALINK